VSRRHVVRVLGLLSALALGVGVAAGPAPARTHYSAKQKRVIRHQLLRAIKKNPRLIKKASFIRKASLVDFTLPITVKLRPNSDTVPAVNSSATIDLGPSLGTREIDLGGSIAGEIQFHDSFDGGALGNVDLTLLPGPKSLTSTSIPLLWNHQVSTGNWDSSITANGGPVGCGDFTNTNATSTSLVPGQPDLPVHLSFPFNPATTAPGFPTVDTGGNPTGDFVPVTPGVDDITNLKASSIPGHDDNLGLDYNPFPTGIGDPGGFTQPPSVKDTVLRTTALQLQIANPADGPVDQTDSSPAGPQGSQNIVIGKSGGQANLFGNIPGKQYGIDVTVNLATKINSILRSVDNDPAHLVESKAWPSALFQCRQAITGYTQNYITGVRLQGNLTISPAITSSGDLRIAKATLSTGTNPDDHIALAACLSPYSALNGELNSTDTTSYPVPVGPYPIPLGGGHFLASSAGPGNQLPANPLTRRDSGSTGDVPQDPSDNTNSLGKAGVCDSTQTQLTKDALFTGLAAAAQANGYTTTADGSRVSVAGDLHVTQVNADVIIGDR
jgi:hypothetical protein